MLEKDSRKAWGISALLHVIIFFIVAAAGLFIMVKPMPKERPVDVTLYEEASGGSDGGGSFVDNSSASAAAADAPVIQVSQEVKLPEIHEEFTKNPEKQKEFRQEHGVKETVTPSQSNASGNNSQGAASSSGNGSGTGAGNGEGSGDNTGGKGNGTGTGIGDGSRPGRDPGKAAVAAVAPVLQSRPAPVYPRNLIENGVEGTVSISIVVGLGGEVESASIVSSSGYSEMDTAALRSAEASVYSPALNVYGEPVRFRKTISFPFRLN